MLLAIAKAGRCHRHRDQGQRAQDQPGPGGTKVDSAVDGLKVIAAGKEINYEGASGPCDFTEIGDIQDCKFRYEQVQGGKIKFVKIA